MLGVKDTSIVIRGFDSAGSFYGSQTLIQFLEYFRTTPYPRCLSMIIPMLPVRGVYMRVKWNTIGRSPRNILSR
jgi:N-acetyl-beta-hexosaminidase